MSRYCAYPEYRDSGVEWLGEIPSIWKAAPIKYLAIFSGGGTPSKENPAFWGGDIPWVSPKDMKSARVTSSIDKITELAVQRSATNLIDSGAVLIVVRSGILQHSIPVAINDVPVTLNQDMKALQFQGSVRAQFAMYVIAGNQKTLLLEWSKQGATVESIEHEFLANSFFPVPSLREQDVVIAFLDHEAAKIDTLIEKQQQLIKLLKEKRQAVISHAVTKGLNPNVPMKDSGVEWLGEVPAHWVSTKLKHLAFHIVDGTHFTPTYVEDGVPFLRVTDIQCKTINIASVKRIPLQEHNELIKRCRPEKGDLLLSKNGTIGVPKVVDWDWDFSIFVSLCLIKLKPGLMSRFAEYFFFSNQIEEQISGLIKQSTVTNLHLDKIADFWISVPSIDEQREIVLYLDRRIGEFDKLIAKANSAILLMQERRTALISAAVTGKIDVRDWQPPATSVEQKEK